MKLYFAPNSRAVGVRWLLEELGVDYELEVLDLKKGQQRSEGFLRINPNGHIPVLVDGTITVIESVAILAYVTDKFIEKEFAPPFGSAARGLYYQWLFYATSTLERHVKQLYLHTAKLPVAQRSEYAANASRVELEGCSSYLEACWSQKTFIMGEAFTTADIALSHWLKNMRDDLGLMRHCPHVLAYLEKILSRPALMRAATVV